VFTCALFGALFAASVNTVKNKTLAKPPFRGVCSSATQGSNPAGGWLKWVLKPIYRQLARLCP
jgi:hypothetical protein